MFAFTERSKAGLFMELERLLNAEYVVYKSNSVCKVEGIEVRNITGTLDKRDYLVLMPINKRESKIYVPADNELLLSKIRRALNKKEIDDVLSSLKGKNMDWIDDRKERTEYFKKALSDGDHRELLLIIRCINNRKLSLAHIHRKISGQDDSVLQNAIKMVSEEFAFSLGIGKEAVGEYIRSALD